MNQNIIQSFNLFSESNDYRTFYWSIYFLLALSSYLTQIHHDSFCNITAEWIRIIHHLTFPIVYLGWLAPTQDLIYVFPIFTIALISWLLSQNFCFLTIWENKLCNHSKLERFHDLTYYGLSSIRSDLRKIRIPYMILVVVISIYRYLEWNTRNPSPSLSNHS